MSKTLKARICSAMICPDKIRSAMKREHFGKDSEQALQRQRRRHRKVRTENAHERDHIKAPVQRGAQDREHIKRPAQQDITKPIFVHPLEDGIPRLYPKAPAELREKFEEKCAKMSPAARVEFIRCPTREEFKASRAQRPELRRLNAMIQRKPEPLQDSGTSSSSHGFTAAEPKLVRSEIAVLEPRRSESTRSEPRPSDVDIPTNSTPFKPERRKASLSFFDQMEEMERTPRTQWTRKDAKIAKQQLQHSSLLQILAHEPDPGHQPQERPRPDEQQHMSEKKKGKQPLVERQHSERRTRRQESSTMATKKVRFASLPREGEEILDTQHGFQDQWTREVGVLEKKKERLKVPGPAVTAAETVWDTWEARRKCDRNVDVFGKQRVVSVSETQGPKVASRIRLDDGHDEHRGILNSRAQKRKIDRNADGFGKQRVIEPKKEKSKSSRLSRKHRVRKRMEDFGSRLGRDLNVLMPRILAP